LLSDLGRRPRFQASVPGSSVPLRFQALVSSFGSVLKFSSVPGFRFFSVLQVFGSSGFVLSFVFWFQFRRFRFGSISVPSFTFKLRFRAQVPFGPRLRFQASVLFGSSGLPVFGLCSKLQFLSVPGSLVPFRFQALVSSFGSVLRSPSVPVFCSVLRFQASVLFGSESFDLKTLSGRFGPVLRRFRP